MIKKLTGLIKYIGRHLRSAAEGFLLLIVVLVIAYPLVKISITIAGRNYVTRTATEFNTGLTNELNYLSSQRDRIAQLPQLQAALANEDVTAINTILATQKKSVTASSVGVTNTSGIVLSRVGVSTKIGDNVFISSAQGRATAKYGQEVSIELRSLDNTQLSVNSGSLIKDNGQIIGGIFASNVIDDTYATKLRDGYLPPGDEVAFYTYTNGLYGTSITNGDEKSIIASYLHPGSSFLDNNPSDQIININGKHFFIKNIVFPGLETSPGGVIILIPSYDQYESLIIATLTGFVFLLLSLLIHKNNRREERYHQYLPRLAILAIIIFAATFILDNQFGNSVVTLNKPIYGIYNSTLSLIPTATVFDSSADQRVDIRVITGGENINSVSAVINYNPAQATITSVDVSSSFCTLFPVNKIDNTIGQVTISCGLPTPGLTTTTGLVAELVLHATKPGTIALDFDKSSQVLANDGLGTDVLRTVSNASYQAISATPVQSQPATASSNNTVKNVVGPSQITVYSPSHPDSEQWYASRNISFTWLDHPGYQYNYSLNQIPDANPDSTLSTSADTIAVTAPTDGVYYLHLQPLLNGITGPLTNFKIMVDSTPPISPAINASSTQINAGDVVRFVLSSNDVTSGLQNNYYIRVDSNLYLPTSTQVFIPFTTTGQHQVSVRVFDNAGNSSDSTVTITVIGQAFIDRVTGFFQSLLSWL